MRRGHNMSAREAQLAEHLAKIDRDMRALEHEHRLATREREALAEDETKMRQREEALRQREETFKRRLTEELDTQVRQARREIDDVIADLKEKTATIAQEAAKDRVTTGDTGTARSDARASVESVARRFLEPVVPTEPEPQAPAGPIPSVGDRVIVGRTRARGGGDRGPRRIGRARRPRQANAGEHQRTPGGRNRAVLTTPRPRARRVQSQPRCNGASARSQCHWLHRRRSAGEGGAIPG